MVFDGPRRLQWSATYPAQFTPVALWPTPAQAAHVLDHLRLGGNVLILLEEERITIPMYAEEAVRIPAELASRVTVTSDGPLSEIRFTAMDWLPPPLRQRGQQFLKDAARILHQRPGLLLPHLITEEPGREPSRLRFARTHTARSLTDSRLLSAADHIFTAPAIPAGASLEGAL